MTTTESRAFRENDASKASIPERVVAYVSKASALVCALGLAGMALGVFAEVVARSIFGYSFRVVEEVSGYLFVGVAFFGFCVAVADRTLFRVELLLVQLPYRLRDGLEALFYIFFLAFLAIMVVHTFGLVTDSFEAGYVAPTRLATPLYIPQLLIPAGLVATFVVVAMRLLQTAYRFYMNLSDGQGGK